MQSAETIQKELVPKLNSLKAQIQQSVIEITCHSCSPRKVIDNPMIGYKITIGSKTATVYFCNELELNVWKERYELKHLPTPVETQPVQ